MPESESPSSADIDPTIERGALQITQRLLEVVGDLQPIAAILRHRNLDLEASKLVPWGSHQELLRAAIGVVQQETARLERIVDEAPTVESGLYNEIIAIAKEVGHPDPEACDLGSVLSLIRERKAALP